VPPRSRPIRLSDGSHRLARGVSAYGAAAMWSRFGHASVALSVCVTAVFLADAALAQAPRPAAPRTTIHWSSGFGAGIEDSRNIRKVETRWGVDYRVGPPLSVGLEVALVRFLGERDERAAKTLGATLLPVVAWHFWRSGDASLAFDIGYGGAVFLPAFPPGGTSLNGYSTVGLQGRLPLRRDVVLLLGVRAMHHSNGRGFVADNPAFDGIALNLGAGFGVGR